MTSTTSHQTTCFAIGVSPIDNGMVHRIIPIDNVTVHRIILIEHVVTCERHNPHVQRSLHVFS